MDIKGYLNLLKKFLYFDTLDFQFFSFLLLDENNDGFVCLTDLFSLFKCKNNLLAVREFKALKQTMFEIFEKVKLG